jgi:hypothetical protein
MISSSQRFDLSEKERDKDIANGIVLPDGFGI